MQMMEIALILRLKELEPIGNILLFKWFFISLGIYLLKLLNMLFMVHLQKLVQKLMFGVLASFFINAYMEEE